MKPDANPARRAAWFTGLVLLLVMSSVFYWNYVPGPRSKGIGFGLISEKQEELRRDLAREARHLNELETWQVQEEIASRSGLSRAGVKGLVQRARQARDPSVMLEALLLSGEVESAAYLAKQRAESLVKTDTRNAARAFRQAGDGYWRNAEYKEAAECYEKAGSEAGMDLALLHWTQANFHPEDVHAELQGARMAIEQWIKNLSADASPLDVAAAHRLSGNIFLKLSIIPDHPSLQTDWLNNAEEAMRLATGALEREMHPELWASIRYDHGVVMLVKSGGEPRSMGPLQDAVLLFSQALEVRTGSIADGAGKADTLALRLSQRAETLAYLAVAQSYLSDFESSGGEGALTTADLALGLSQPQDPGVTWFMAQYAKLRTMVEHPSIVSEKAEAVPARFSELVTAFERTLENYPISSADYPGVPPLSEVVGLASTLCENCAHSLTKEQLREPSDRLVTSLKPHVSDVKSPAHTAALKATASSLNLAIEGGASVRRVTPFRMRPEDHAEVFNETEKLPLSPWRQNMPPGRLWRGQMQRMEETLDRWSR